MIDYVSPLTGDKLFANGSFLVSERGEKFPVVNGIPRFVSNDNYADAFGLQWKAYAKTQLDSYTGTPISRSRLERCLGFPVEQLKGKNVLEAGCGAGRFTELLVNAGANVHSIDLSSAVEANLENIGAKENYKISQASIYEMPFTAESFDYVLCLGVVQHTPSSEKTIQSLWKMVKPGGTLVIDHYKWRIGYYSTLTPLFREVLRKMKPERAKKKVDALVDFFFPMHWSVRKMPVLNWLLHRVSPLIFYYRFYPDKDRAFHYEWSKLDTHDQLTDYYKHLKTPSQIRQILERLSADNIEVWLGGNGVEARCRKPLK
jgi:SAM-dependent methyltransferase